MPAALIAGLGPAAIAAPAPADETPPSIVQYETAKQRRDAAASARRPRTFWVRALAKTIDDIAQRADLPKHGETSLRIGFTIAHDGHLVGARIVESSGDRALDAAILALVAKAGPFAPMPEAFGPGDQSFTLPIRFR